MIKISGLHNYFYIVPLFILVAGYFLFPKVIAFARHLDYLDEGSGRKRHKDKIPPIGGWLLYFAFFIAFLVTFLIPDFGIKNIGIFLSFTGLFALGVVDDKYPMNAPQKFVGQFIVAVLFVFIGQIHLADYMYLYGFPVFVGKLISVVIIVFIVNAYNLMDGINGLAALLGVVAISFLGLWLYSAARVDYFILCLSLLAALFVFLRYNLFKPTVFLGDNGSMIIGLLAIYFAFEFINTYTGYYNIVLTKCNAELGVALAAMAIPIADTLRLFILRPYYLKKSPFKADRNHVHHLLLRLGFSHSEASLALFGLAILLVLSALAAQDLGSIAVFVISAFICIAFLMSLDFLVFSRYRRRVNKKTMFNSLQNISKDLDYPVFIELTFAISIFLLAISIPFHRVSTSIPTIIIVFSFLALFVRNLIVYRNKYWKVLNGKFKQFIQHPYSLLVVGFLVFNTVHIVFIEPTGNWGKMTIYLLLFIYWLTIFQLEKIVQIKPRVLLTAFITGCLGFGVYILMKSIAEFPSNGWDGFFYKDLLSNVKANPVTHSLYYNLAILFLGNNYRYVKREEWRIVYWFMFIFFISMVVLCSSKIGWLVLFFTVMMAIYSMMKNKKAAISFVSIYALFGLGGAFYLGVFSADFIFVALDSRIVVWEQSMSIIKENYLFGTGIGNSVAALKESFIQIGYERGVAQNYNAQNQFLESFLESGIIGFLFLVSFFAFSFIKAILERNKLYFMYTLIIVVYMFAESLFQTQMGMVSFAFFNALFLAAFYNQRSEL